MTVTWPGNNLHRWNTIRARFSISNCTCIVDYKLCQICWWWKKIYINDVTIVVTWSAYNLQTRHKMRTGFCISRLACSIGFKLCQVCSGDKRFISIMSSWYSLDLDAIYRPDNKRGPGPVRTWDSIIICGSFKIMLLS